jgi:hypothetical protein
MWSRGNYSSHSIVCDAGNAKPRKDRCPVGTQDEVIERLWSRSDHVEMINHPWGHQNAAESPVFSDENGAAWRPTSEHRGNLRRRKSGGTGSKSALAS